MRAIIYTKPKCQPCRMTKIAFEKRGIPYEERSALEAMDHIAALGYSSAPVIEADYGEGVTAHWSGFRPSMIDQLSDTL